MPNLLFLSTGWRYRVIERMAEIGRELENKYKRPYRVYAGDANPMSVSLLAANHILLPRYSAPEFRPKLKKFCKANKISGIVPMGEREYDVLMDMWDELDFNGTTVLLPLGDTVKTCRDKWKLAERLKGSGIRTPQTFLADSPGIELKDLPYPLFIKPRVTLNGGYMGILENADDAQYWIKKQPGSIMQTLITGREITLDILAGPSSELLAFVPRERLFVRGGEVNKGRTIRDNRFEAFSHNILDMFPSFGVLTVQCFLQPQGEPVLIEINTRIGGGFPLTLTATGTGGFGAALFHLAEGKKVEPFINEYRELTMLRYDQDVIFAGDSPFKHTVT